MLVNSSSVGEVEFSQPKKARLSEVLKKKSGQVSSVSPVLQHKIPVRSSNDDECDDDSDDSDEKNECREKTNLFGVHFVMWFEVGIEGKDPMDQNEEDWGGKIEFGHQGKSFPTDLEDHFRFLRTGAHSYTLVLVGSWGSNPMSERKCSNLQTMIPEILWL